MDLNYAAFVSAVALGLCVGWILGALMVLSRVRAAERVLHLVAQELAVPSYIRRAVADYFDWER